MVFSVKANRKRILAVLAVVAIVVCGIIIIPKMVTAPMKHYGETPAQRVEFLQSFGWAVSKEPIDSRDVMIPKEFNEVYAKYNVMQKAQGFDLKPYSGMNCKQFIYLIENYPGTDREIHATLLVYEGLIIGGDVSCAEVDGFMHGFAADSARYGADPVKAEDPKTESKTDAPKSDESASSEKAANGDVESAEDVNAEPQDGEDAQDTGAEPQNEEDAEYAEDVDAQPDDGDAEDTGAEVQEEPVDADLYPTD